MVILLAGSIVPITPAQARPTASPHDRVFCPVLTLHHVKWDKPTDDAIELGLTIHPTQFKQELDYLASHRYHTVTALQLAGFLLFGRRLPSNPVVMSFDDAYIDQYTAVYPALRRHHMTGTFFIPTGLLGKPRYMSWGQVEDMARHGMDIEAHSVSHPDLTIVPPAQRWGEISQSRAALQAHLLRQVRIMAYPYGAYNATVIADVQKAGYWAAFTTQQGWVQRRDQMATLPRVYVDRDDTLPIFAGRLRADPAVLAGDPG